MRLLRLITNKYLIAAAAFGVWMLFFDQNDWQSQRESKKKLELLDQNIEYLNAEIDQMDKERTALTNDPKALERFARERYRMKRDGEDLYVVEP
jgi:cell division protein FtsB